MSSNLSSVLYDEDSMKRYFNNNEQEQQQRHQQQHQQNQQQRYEFEEHSHPAFEKAQTTNQNNASSKKMNIL